MVLSPALSAATRCRGSGDIACRRGELATKSVDGRGRYHHADPGEADVVKIYTASDHAGFSLRKVVVERLRAQGKEVVDLGTDSETACDYPEFAYAVASKVRGEPGALGILVCATGQGMAMAAGKVRGIRASAPSSLEAARLSRVDNNANILCLAGRLLSEATACAMVEVWLSTSFAGGRHARRIAKISAIETASAVAFMTESERRRLVELGFPGKLFDRDPLRFGTPENGSGQVVGRRAWVTLPHTMADQTSLLVAFADGARQAKWSDAILLYDNPGEAGAAGGAAGLAVASLFRALASGSSGIRLHVVAADQSLAALADAVRPKSTLVVVSSHADHVSKELEAREQLWWARMLEAEAGDEQRAGRHFVAVTRPGNGLALLAESHRYARVFLDPAILDACFAALGWAGMVPAVLAGFDPVALIAKAKAMAEACRVERLEDNPGASLGVLIGALAKQGRNKLTLLRSKSLAALARWIGLLLPGATAHAQPGVEVLDGEPLQSTYAADRIFVHLQYPGDAAAIAPEAMESLHIAGQPYIQISVADRLDLAAEIFRWQVAAVVAALVLGATPLA